MIQKKKYLVILLIGVLCCISVSPTAYCDSDDYDLAIEENSEVIWEVTDADEAEIEAFLSYTDYDGDDFDFEEEDEFTYKINSISEVSDDYYSIDFNYFEDDEDHGTKSERVAMDPGDMAEKWEENNIDSYSMMFILTDIEDYLDEFEDDISDIYKNFVFTTSSKIILNATSIGYPYVLIMEYEDRGILDEFTLIYQGNEIFKVELKDYIKPPEFPLLGVMIVILIVGGIITGVVIVVVSLNKSAKKKAKLKPPVPITPYVETKTEVMTTTKEVSEPEIKKGPEKSLFCPVCGSKRESDAKFCPYCGNSI